MLDSAPHDTSGGPSRAAAGAVVAVLGAGLAGCSTALELARSGIRVLLLDQDAVPMNRASLRNEGKIHLGFVYANDRTGDTARLMLDGALSFQPLLRRWLGAQARLPLSTPFLYLVADDSVVAPDALEEHYACIQRWAADRLREDRSATYLGRRPPRLFRRVPLATVSARIGTGTLQAVYQTAERAVDTDALGKAFRSAVLAHARITFLPSRRVRGVQRRGHGFALEGDGPDGRWSLQCDQVVNATWEGRLALDASLGLPVADGWLHRLKYRVIATLPPALRDAPSATMVLGRYGDVVVWPNRTGFFSWYPLGLRGWTHDLEPPADWNAAATGQLAPEEAAPVARAILEAVDAWYPGARHAEPVLVDAGTIVAYGATDVDDRDSGLHDRTRVGVTTVDGYHSLDPGKLTTAPMFGDLAAKRVLALA